MRTKELGRTGVQVAEIGLGTWQYSGGVAALRKGVAAGATFIDTAEAYGTEDIVGQAVQDIRDEVFLATKVSSSNFRRDDVVAAADSSLRRLRTDRIDLYQLHWPSYSIPVSETMEAMARLVDQGKVRFIGVSNFSVAQLREAQDVVGHTIASNQVPYSLANRDIEDELLAFCQDKGVTVIAYSPLARGLDSLRQSVGRGALAEVASAAGKTEAQVTLNWCISKNDVIAIPKSDSVDRTVENAGASGWRLTSEQVAALESGG